MKIDENSVLTACSKCMPKPGESGKLHKLDYENGRLMCQNPECRYDWTNWSDKSFPRNGA